MPAGIRNSLKAKIFLIFFVLNLSVILLVGAISYQSKKEALLDQAKASLLIIASELADKVDRYIAERMDDADSLALQYSLYGLKTTTSGQNNILARYMRIYPYYEHISIINLEDVRMPGAGESTSSGYGKTWFLPALKGNLVVSDMFISPLTDRPTMAFAAPVRDKNGRIVSVLTANLNIEYLKDIVGKVREENLSWGQSGYATMINRQGVLIAHPKTEKVLVENLSRDKNPDIRAMVSEMTAGRSGTAIYTYEGVKKLAAYSPCKGYGRYTGQGWTITATMPYSELLAPMKSLLQKYLVILLLTSLLALYVSTKLAGYLVRPIRALMEGAANIGEGDFGMRIAIKSQDEIGGLARSFNRMAGTLEARDSQIKEYTDALSLKNAELGEKQRELSLSNEALQHTNEELVRIEAQKTELTAMISHDIKSPLSAIISYAELILDGSISGGEEIRKAVSNIHAGGYKILRLVDNFLVSTAIESGKLQINLAPLDINEFVEDEMPFFAPQMEKKDIKFSVEKLSPMPLIMADKIQLDRALSNLVTNAVKFTPAGGTVSLRTGKEGGWVTVAVSDSGQGIPESDIDGLFAKYKRSRATGRIEGFGLGLFISKAIVEGHGGRVTVTSRPGQGSAFTIYLPVKA